MALSIPPALQLHLELERDGGFIGIDGDSR